MRVSLISIGLLAPLLTVMLTLLSACGGSQPAVEADASDPGNSFLQLVLGSADEVDHVVRHLA